MLEIAQYVQSAILKYANKNIEIQVNNEDKSVHSKTLAVSSAKLKSIIDYKNPIMFEEEALNIFKLLSK